MRSLFSSAKGINILIRISVVCPVWQVREAGASISCSVCTSVRPRPFLLALNVTSDGHPHQKRRLLRLHSLHPLVSCSLCYRMINLMLNLEAVFLAQRERDYWQRESDRQKVRESVYECRRLAIHNKSICKDVLVFFSLMRAIVVTDFPLCDLFAVILTVYCCFI